MNPHFTWCPAYTSSWRNCTCGRSGAFTPAPAPKNHAVSLTVYTTSGTFTVENVREDSIEYTTGGKLIAESDDALKTHLFAFFGVGGYSTRIP